MKKLLLATSCLALSSTISMAADMSIPYTKAPSMAAPVFSWTGCYVGAQVGGGLLSNSEGAVGNGNGKGAIAGGQGGCNYQDGSWVFGIEGEGYWSGIKTTATDSGIANPVNNGTAFTDTSTFKNRYDFTIAARAGITFDRTFVYGKGGWAWGAFRSDNSDNCCGGPGTPTVTRSFSGTLDGFLVGVGIEHALTRNWTVKLEYDFIGYGSKEVADFRCNGTGICAVTGTTSFDANKHVFKVGANYLFDFGGPVVAKY
jgi:outer membrane immunogenic protein